MPPEITIPGNHPLLIATSNPHKVDEIRAVLDPLGFHLDDLRSIVPPPQEPLEDAPTFAGNARIKATAYARMTGRWCLADDSGLEVDALGGQPGVHSARYARHSDGSLYANRKFQDKANNRALLDALVDVPDMQRTARFVCAMCIADPDGHIIAESRGEFAGVIVTDGPRGCNGFGYDPLLYIPELNCTSAELAPTEKNARSHRGHAARAIASMLLR
ncbi:MAG: non-canonical purine NTP pyrophosphatase [Phycisphaerales bacterium]